MSTALVIGARKPGIGFAIATRLVKDGYIVHGISSADDQESPAPEGLASNVIVDLTDRTQIASTLDHLELENIDAVAYADFLFVMENPAALDWEAWQSVLAANLTAPYVVFRHVYPRLAQGASFVIVTSTEGFVGSFGASGYAASKAAIHNLVKTLANLSGENQIRTNAVAAGWIGGVMDTDDVFNMSRRITPLGRLGSPDEIAAVVAFLLSGEASFVNGTCVVADGGYSGVDTIAKYEYEQSIE